MVYLNKFSVIFLTLVLLNLTFISAFLNVSISDQGADVRNKANGALLTGGDLVVSIYDDPSAGNLIYTEI